MSGPKCVANEHSDGLGCVSLSGRDFEVADAIVKAHRAERERGCISGGTAHHRALGAYRAEVEKAERERVLGAITAACVWTTHGKHEAATIEPFELADLIAKLGAEP